ncbi:MAG: DUF177 domain-containing protein [Clostridia bacterium]|nr:DUF177 domain-containing protein [Clostridia bacterium]
MLIDVSPILRGETARLEFSFELKSPDDFRDIHFSDTVSIHGVITDTAGYMTLVIDSDVPFVTHCARCAKTIERIYPLHIERTLALTLENEDNDDYLLIKGNKIDMDEELSEELVLGIDFAHYCKDDCKGLCPKCGKDLNEGECSCPKKEIDPRLANLAKLLDK